MIKFGHFEKDLKKYLFLHQLQAFLQVKSHEKRFLFFIYSETCIRACGQPLRTLTSVRLIRGVRLWTVFLQYKKGIHPKLSKCPLNTGFFVT